jgi:hypothetical protein
MRDAPGGASWIGCPAVDGERFDALMTSMDTLTGCATCGVALDDRSPSSDFCSQDCALEWRNRDAQDPCVTVRSVEIDALIRAGVDRAVEELQAEFQAELQRLTRRVVDRAADVSTAVTVAEPAPSPRVHRFRAEHGQRVHVARIDGLPGPWITVMRIED